MLEEAEEGSGPALTWGRGDRWARIQFASPHYSYRDPSNPYLAADDMVEYVVQISGPGLTAEAPVMNLSGEGDGLLQFFEVLADEFRGWDGTRTWESVEHQLASKRLGPRSDT